MIAGAEEPASSVIAGTRSRETPGLSIELDEGIIEKYRVSYG